MRALLRRSLRGGAPAAFCLPLDGLTPLPRHGPPCQAEAMSKHYKTPVLLIEFEGDKAFALQASSGHAGGRAARHGRARWGSRLPRLGVPSTKPCSHHMPSA